MDMQFPYKERRTETHVYFVGGPFSQWYADSFRARVFPGYPEETFNKNEQFMMAAKAALFNDEKIYNAIMLETNPRKQKDLGRAVGGFTEEQWKQDAGPIWDLVCEELVFRGQLAKYKQNADRLQYLLDTGDRIIVEGAHYDRVWGVGLAYDDPRIEDEANWLGLNRLGKVHMRCRDYFRSIDA